MGAGSDVSSGMQVMGLSGISRPCLYAIEAVLDSAALPNKATIVTLETRLDTGQEEHLFLFWDWCGVPLTVVRNGFSSGYPGEGPRSFSLAICMIRSRSVPIDGFYATEAEFRMLDSGSISSRLCQKIKLNGQALTWPWPLWVSDRHEELLAEGLLWDNLGWDRPEGDLNRALRQIRVSNMLVWRKLCEALQSTLGCSESEQAQPAGVLLRDAWIELAQKLGEETQIDRNGLGTNDVKGLMRRILRNDVEYELVRSNYDFALRVQHDRDVDPTVARRCILMTVLTMSTVLSLTEPLRTNARTYYKCPQCGSLKVIETVDSIPDFDGPPIPQATAKCETCGWGISWQP